MHKFKIGDKIRSIKGSIAHEKYGNAILTVTKDCCNRIDNYGHTDYIEPNGMFSGWNTDYFELAYPKPLSEVDFLDAFQRNFSDRI